MVHTWLIFRCLGPSPPASSLFVLVAPSVCGVLTTLGSHVVASYSDTNLVCASIQSAESNSASVLAVDYKQEAKSGVRWVHVVDFNPEAMWRRQTAMMSGKLGPAIHKSMNNDYFLPVIYVSYAYEKEDSATLLLYKTRWDSLNLLSLVMNNKHRHSFETQIKFTNT